MKKIVIVVMVLFSFLNISKLFAGAGCDALDTYVYNLSNKTIVAYASEDSEPQQGQQIIPPGSLVALGTSTTSSYQDFVYSYVTLFLGSTQLAQLGVRKEYTYAPKPTIEASLPHLFLLDDKRDPFDPNALVISNRFSRGYCADYTKGSWIIIVENPSLPLPSLKTAIPAKFPLKMHRGVYADMRKCEL